MSEKPGRAAWSEQRLHGEGHVPESGGPWLSAVKLGGSGEPLAAFDPGDVQGRVTWWPCWPTGLQVAERPVRKVLQLSESSIEWPEPGPKQGSKSQGKTSHELQG